MKMQRKSFSSHFLKENIATWPKIASKISKFVILTLQLKLLNNWAVRKIQCNSSYSKSKTNYSIPRSDCYRFFLNYLSLISQHRISEKNTSYPYKSCNSTNTFLLKNISVGTSQCFLQPESDMKASRSREESLKCDQSQILVIWLHSILYKNQEIVKERTMIAQTRF